MIQDNNHQGPQPNDILDDEELTEFGMSSRFATHNQGNVRHVAGYGWLVWDGARFTRNDGAVQELVKQEIQRLRHEADQLGQRARTERARSADFDGRYLDTLRIEDDAKRLNKEAIRIKKAYLELSRAVKIRSIMTVSETLPGIACRITDFDQDAWLLNVHNGVVDLRTGGFQKHDAQLLQTKVAGVEFLEGAKAPIWEKFLQDVFCGDQDMIRFIRQLIGYTLTGDTREQHVLILEGGGGNGKGVFLDTIITLMGDYSRTFRKEVLTLRQNGDSQGDADLANLPGARLASINELGDGDRLNVSRVKELTGGEELTANPKYMAPFSFTSAAKLWIRTNHLPVARMDLALADRIIRIPFKARFRGTAGEDKSLKARLLDELPGILNWAIEGVLDWRQNGLVIPVAAEEASSEYILEQDHFSRWLGELELKPVMACAWLYKSYETWCSEQGHAPLSQVSFGSQLTTRGWSADSRRVTTGGKKVRVRIPPQEQLARLATS